MEHDFDLRVIDQRNDRSRIYLAVERVNQLCPSGFAVSYGVDGNLHQAELGPITAFAHELGVERQRARLLGALSNLA